MDVVFYKRSAWSKFTRYLARCLTDLAYSINTEGYEDFLYDNDYAYCPDCDRCRR